MVDKAQSHPCGASVKAHRVQRRLKKRRADCPMHENGADTPHIYTKDLRLWEIKLPMNLLDLFPRRLLSSESPGVCRETAGCAGEATASRSPCADSEVWLLSLGSEQRT